MISHKDEKAIEGRNRNLFNIWYWSNWTFTNKNMNLDQSFIPYTKTDSKWMTNLNVNHNTIKLLEKEIRENLWDLVPGKQF